MKKIILLTGILLTISLYTNAQFLEGLGKKVKDKVKQRIDKKTDEGIDKGLDKTEEGVKGGAKKSENNTETSPSDSEGATNTNTTSKQSLKSSSKFDFVPGNKVIYAEDFSQDEIGELPLGWNTNNRGEVVTLNALPGKWLSLIGRSKYLTANKAPFDKNFTIEFDLAYNIEPNGYALPSLTFGFLSSNDDPTNDNKFLQNLGFYQNSAIVLSIFPAGKKKYGESYNATVQTNLDKAKFFASERKSIDNLKEYNDKISHVAVQVQGSRLRCWINDFKAFDLPMALPTKYSFNQLFFELEGSNYKDDEIGYYISNIKVATGLPDTRNKLITEGKFTTTGILFNVNSDQIKPESAGVLKEIAQVLKDNADVKVKIVGHTDSDGKDADNLSLSKRRAAAVKTALEADYGIDGERMQTDGKGESTPLAPNTTKEGKAQNRRVEFIKL